MISFFIYGSAVSTKEKGHSNVICRKLKLLASSFRTGQSQGLFIEEFVQIHPVWKYKTDGSISDVLSNICVNNVDSTYPFLCILMKFNVKKLMKSIEKISAIFLKYALQYFESAASSTEFGFTNRFVSKFTLRKVITVSQFITYLTDGSHSLYKLKVSWLFNRLDEVCRKVCNETLIKANFEKFLESKLRQQKACFCFPSAYNKTLYIIVPSHEWQLRDVFTTIYTQAYMIKFFCKVDFPNQAFQTFLTLVKIFEDNKPESLLMMDDIFIQLKNCSESGSNLFLLNNCLF